MCKTQKFKTSIIAVMMSFIIGISAWLFYNWTTFQKPRLDLPGAKWEEIFFTEIDRVTDLAGLTKLREKRLPEDDIEIRIWEGFGLEDLEAVILLRENNIWSAYYVESNANIYATKAKATKIYRTPKSGWESFTKQIFERDILTISDAEEGVCSGGGFDNRNYVVEIYKNKVYRTYRHLSVDKPMCDGERKINEIAEIIAKEFYREGDRCLETEWIPCMVLYPPKK